MAQPLTFLAALSVLQSLKSLLSSKEFIQPEESKSSCLSSVVALNRRGKEVFQLGSSLCSLRLKYFVNSCAFVKFVSRLFPCCGCGLRRGGQNFIIFSPIPILVKKESWN